MAAETLLTTARSLAILALLLLVVQWWLFRLRARQAEKRHVQARMKSNHADVLVEDQEVKLAGGQFDRLQLKAGLNIDQSMLLLVITAIVTFSIVAGFLFGVLWGVLLPVIAVSMAALYWNIRYQRRRRQVFESLPEAIDDVIRSVDAGRSLEQALVSSFTDASPVFSPLAFRLRSAVEAGRDYTGLMDDFARLYNVPPLFFVAVALRTSTRFGSSIRPVLRKVSEALRTQQEMRREFIAATAEIRFTAVAFAVLPIGIGIGLIALNEGFRQVLLDTDAGHKILAASVALIVTGTLIIFRMVQGVGRG